jgi:hypothetical protein
VQNDPVNFVDPTGLDGIVIDTGPPVTVIGNVSGSIGNSMAGLGVLEGSPLDAILVVTIGDSIVGGGDPQNTIPTGHPSQKLSGCTFNVSLSNNNLLDSKQLQAMKNEIGRIFATAGQEINFVSSNADYYLNINAHGANYTNKPNAVGITYLNGSTVTNNGRVFVDRLTASAASDSSSATAFNQDSNALAIGLGRAGTHEIAHYFLQQNYDSSKISGVMHNGFKGVQWFGNSTQGLWKFTPTQIKQLNRLCGR